MAVRVKDGVVEQSQTKTLVWAGRALGGRTGLDIFEVRPGIRNKGVRSSVKMAARRGKVELQFGTVPRANGVHGPNGAMQGTATTIALEPRAVAAAPDGRC